MMDFETYLLEQINHNPQFLRLRPILEKIVREKREGQVYVIALDGPAASGKSTIAKQLGKILNADVVKPALIHL